MQNACDILDIKIKSIGKYPTPRLIPRDGAPQADFCKKLYR